MQPQTHKWIVGILLLLYAVIQSYCIQQLSVNYDEGLFSYYGATILKGRGNKDIVKFDSKLPITALNMLPRAVEQLCQPRLKRADAYIDIMRGRYISLLVTVILALFVWAWSTQLYGLPAGLFSCTVFLLCPNFLAHGIFVSSDIFACLFTTASFYFLWKFNKADKVKYFILASTMVALAQVAKFSMVHLLLLFPLLMLTGDFIKGRSMSGRKWSISQLGGLLVLFAVINWFVICVAHLFYGMFIPLDQYKFSSTTFQHLQSMLQGAGSWLRIPFPSSYIKSMDAVIYFDHLGGGAAGSLNGPSYLLGKSSGKGFWYYYFVVLFYKLPLPVLIMLFISVVYYIRTFKRASFFQNDVYILLPAMYFIIYLNFFYSTQLGIRHIMIILPLLYIFCGVFLQAAGKATGVYIICALLAWQCISVGRYFPHFLPYTNELIPDKKMAYQKLADSNICYGEGGKYLAHYLDLHPGAQYLPPKIASGQIIMEVNEMLNLNIATMHKFDWVRALTPVDHIHSQYLIFEVSPAQADSLKKVHQ